MKAIPVLLLAAACLAYYVARRAAPQTYVAPIAQELPEGPSVPRFLSRAAGPGERLCVLEVDGMCCAGCTSKVYEAVSAVDGVVEVSVDFASKSAKVLVRDDLELAQLERSLTFDKYSAKLRP